MSQYVIGTTLHFVGNEIANRDFVVYLYNEQVNCWNKCCKEAYKYLSMLESLALDIDGEKILSFNEEIRKLESKIEAIQSYRKKVGPRIGKKIDIGEIKIGDETYRNFRNMEKHLKKLNKWLRIKETNKYKVSHGIVKTVHPHMSFFNFMKNLVNEQRPYFDLKSEDYEYLVSVSFQNAFEKYLFKKGGIPKLKETINDIYPHTRFKVSFVKRYRNKQKKTFSSLVQKLTKDTEFLTTDLIKNKKSSRNKEGTMNRLETYNSVKLIMPYKIWNIPQEDPLVSVVRLTIKKNPFHRPEYIFYFTVDESPPKIESEEKNDFTFFPEALVEDGMICFASCYVNGERRNLFIPGGTKKTLDNKRRTRYKPKLDVNALDFLAQKKSDIAILYNDLVKRILPLIKRYHNLYEKNKSTLPTRLSRIDRYPIDIDRLYEFFHFLPVTNDLENEIKELLDVWYKKYKFLKFEAVGFEKNLHNKRIDFFKKLAHEIASTARTVKLPAPGVVSNLQQKDTVSLPKEVNIRFRKIKKYAGSGYFFTYLRQACERAGIEVVEHGYSSINLFEKDLTY